MSTSLTPSRPIPEPVAVPPASGNLDPGAFTFFKDDFAFVDTETTGVDPEVDRIVEIAIVRFRGGEREVFHTLVNPGFPIPPTASAVHHITDRIIQEANAPTFDQIADKVAEMLDGAHVYAHNRDFDEAFVDGELGVELNPKSWLCTVRLSRHLLPTAPAYGNQVLHYWLMTSPESADLGPHRAIDDVFTSLENTYHVWRQAELLGVRTHDGLLELCNRPIMVSSMAFGKHVGKEFKDIPSTYFEWCLGPDGMKDMDEDLRHSMEAELKRPGRAEDDARIAAEQASNVVPSSVMLFGKQHYGKPMTQVPQEYLEWMERESPRCTPEVKAGALQELDRRRTGSAPAKPAGASATDVNSIAASTYVKLAGLVNKGSHEAQLLGGTQEPGAAPDAFSKYLKDFAARQASDFLRVSHIVGGREGEWMRNHGQPIQDSRASASVSPTKPSVRAEPARSAGRLSLFAGTEQRDPVEDSGPPPEGLFEGASAPFEQAAAPRRMRPR